MEGGGRKAQRVIGRKEAESTSLRWGNMGKTFIGGGTKGGFTTQVQAFGESLGSLEGGTLCAKNEG